MIHLPYTFGEKVRSAIDKYRDKNNLDTPEEIKKLYNKNEHFLESEFDLVEELYITEEAIQYLHLFKNVKVLNITCAHQFTNEEVQKIINTYPNLEELNVANQNKITYLNLEEQPNLQELTIHSNKNLSRILGLRDLSNLFEIIVYDNPELLEVYNKLLCAKVLKESLHGTRCKLDLLYIKELLELLPSNISQEQLKLLDIKFVEQLKDNTIIENIEHSVAQTIFVYENAKEIVEKYTKETDTPKQKFAIINEWLCQNVIYDHDGMERQIHVSNGQQRGIKGGTNSCINAILYKTCVCQGYTKAAQLLLKIAGIESYDVGCVATDDDNVRKTLRYGERKISYSDHSILRVLFPNNEEYYSDITWDAGKIQDGKPRENFLLSKEDISKKHQLEGEEEIKTSKTISLVEEEALLKFAKKRIEDVDKKTRTR